ncbi:MAG: HU family DNA-binding protein [Alphaproteobacteria bacterium]|nr:HU family DNA-binding protein [Alphaproteobacteria bacterium]
MKLKQLNEAIAAACNVRPQLVTAVQTETFRQIKAALDKGEKIVVPDWGIFAVKETPAMDGKPAKKIVRFRDRTGEIAEKKEKKGKGEGKKAKREKDGKKAEPVDKEAGED